MIPVVFTPKAQDQLLCLYRYIADASFSGTAARYVAEVIDYCESLCLFPERGIRRDDLRPGLRITHYCSRTSIAFMIYDNRLEILGIFHGGQNYTKVLKK